MSGVAIVVSFSSAGGEWGQLTRNEEGTGL